MARMEMAQDMGMGIDARDSIPMTHTYHHAIGVTEQQRSLTLIIEWVYDNEDFVQLETDLKNVDEFIYSAPDSNSLWVFEKFEEMGFFVKGYKSFMNKQIISKPYKVHGLLMVRK